MGTEKRERQKAGRQERREAEQKAAKRRQSLRRVITIVVVAAVVVGVSFLLFKPGSKASSSTTTTRRRRPPPVRPPPAARATSAERHHHLRRLPGDLSATLNKPSYPSYPPTAIDPTKTYTATIKTDVGPITVALDAKTAPKAVNSFVFLADKHYFDCNIFHRVIPGFVNQTGDPTGTGTGGPGYRFADELPGHGNAAVPAGLAGHGQLRAPNTNGSQFFIVAGPQGEALPPSYTLFGR